LTKIHKKSANNFTSKTDVFIIFCKKSKQKHNVYISCRNLFEYIAQLTYQYCRNFINKQYLVKNYYDGVFLRFQRIRLVQVKKNNFSLKNVLTKSFKGCIMYSSSQNKVLTTIN